MKFFRRNTWCLLVVSLGLIAAGCGTKLRLAPVPQTQPGPTGAQARTFDFDGNGHAEYREIFGPGGNVRYHEFDRDGDGVYEQVVDRATLDPNKTRHVFLLLDGVPYSLVEQMWRDGYFRIFSRPGRLVSTFPSLTDPAYYRIFHCGRPYGYEAEFYDRSVCRKTGGAGFYLSGKNEAWGDATDYRINFIEDAVMYLFPGGVFKREMNGARRVYDRRTNDDRVVLYLLSTDGICHMYTRERAYEHLVLLDRWIEQLVYDAGGQVHVTMFADHGNNFSSKHYVPLKQALRNAGLRISDKLDKPGEVGAPQFGLINFGSIFCYSNVELQRAVLAVRALDGVDAVAWRADGGIRVSNRKGTAAIRRKAEAGQFLYSYQPMQGDPLELASVVAALQETGKADAEGFVTDADWFEATKGGAMPYAVPRLYNSLHTNVINSADIVVSLADGYYYGDRTWEKYVQLHGTHGGLSRESTVSFLMSSAFVAPEYVRTDEILPVINQYVTWTPKIEWTDYAWLERPRALQEGPVAKKAGSPIWPEATPASQPAAAQVPSPQSANGPSASTDAPASQPGGMPAGAVLGSSQ